MIAAFVSPKNWELQYVQLFEALAVAWEKKLLLIVKQLFLFSAM